MENRRACAAEFHCGRKKQGGAQFVEKEEKRWKQFRGGILCMEKEVSLSDADSCNRVLYYFLLYSYVWGNNCL